ncbi:MAG: hypothetical protein QOJ96_3528 [Alphaproteobacteria bacterium]|nr:hypothetical protein [Alphaproteobacteria bacterium]
MSKGRNNPDYIEWDSKEKTPAPEAPKSPVESLLDAEIRRRIGEVIARAAEGKKKEE